MPTLLACLDRVTQANAKRTPFPAPLRAALLRERRRADRNAAKGGPNLSDEQIVASIQRKVQSALAELGSSGVADIVDDEVLLSAARGPGSDIGHKREKSTGRYVGAPEWVGSSPQKLAKLRRILMGLAEEGVGGRFC